MQWFQEHNAAVSGGQWIAQLMAAIAKLQAMPTRCSLAAEANDLGLEIRELRIGKHRGSHRLLFQIEGKTVHIVRVWHSARDAVSPDDL